MADLGNPSTIHELVGVYRDRVVADRVVREVTALGVPASSIHVDDADANVAALKGEMREEIDNTIVGAGNVGPFTKEMSKGIARQLSIWTIALALAGLGLALFDWPGSNLEFGTRMIIGAVVGAVTGATIGFVWGGGRGASREPSLHKLAAERGVVVAVSAPQSVAARAVRVMRDADPIRLDLGSLEGSPVETITTGTDDPASRG